MNRNRNGRNNGLVEETLVSAWKFLLQQVQELWLELLRVRLMWLKRESRPRSTPWKKLLQSQYHQRQENCGKGLQGVFPRSGMNTLPHPVNHLRADDLYQHLRRTRQCLSQGQLI